MNTTAFHWTINVGPVYLLFTVFAVLEVYMAVFGFPKLYLPDEVKNRPPWCSIVKNCITYLNACKIGRTSSILLFGDTIDKCRRWCGVRGRSHFYIIHEFPIGGTKCIKEKIWSSLTWWKEKNNIIWSIRDKEF